MTAVTIQPNKIVSSEVKDTSALLEPSYGKKPNGLFGQPNTFFSYVFNQREKSSQIYVKIPCVLFLYK